MGTDEQGRPAEELFRELLRLMPGACVDDYYKHGKWQVETILTDTELLEMHRKEAGAPDPPPLSEVKLPQMPKLPVQVAPMVRPSVSAGGTVRLASASPAGVSATVPSGLIKPAPAPVVPKTLTPQRIVPLKAGAVNAAKTVMPKKPLIKPVLPKGSSVPPKGASAVVGPGGPSAELRQIALFIQKWKLEATKAKLVLARLTPARRRWVIANYKGAPQLEQYIAQCERSNSWAGAGSAAPTSAGGGGGGGDSAYTRAGGATTIRGYASGAKATQLRVPAAKMGSSVAAVAYRSAAVAGAKQLAGAKRPLSAGPTEANKRIRVAPPPQAAAARGSYQSPPGPPQARPLARAPAMATSRYAPVAKPAGAPKPGGAIIRPITPRPAAPKVATPYGRPTAAKPVGALGGQRFAPKAGGAPKAGAKPGSLIRSLLKRV